MTRNELKYKPQSVESIGPWTQLWEEK